MLPPHLPQDFVSLNRVERNKNCNCDLCNRGRNQLNEIRILLSKRFSYTAVVCKTGMRQGEAVVQLALSGDYFKAPNLVILDRQ